MEIKIERKELLKKLTQWRGRKNRKPLILQGARQVGKTWLLKEFGKTEFDDVALFNFDKNRDLKQIFANSKDINRITTILSLVHGRKIEPEKTLIIFDEIQECNDALNTLKYFYEDAPQYCIAAAGSLLGVAMSRGAAFPVGKVDFLHVKPVTFIDFLQLADKNLYDYVNAINTIEPIPDLFFNRLSEKFKMYFISGGMPEAIVNLIEHCDMERVQNALSSILQSYMYDFSKYVENSDVPKIAHIWNSLPSQLAKENKKFLYQTVKTGARARDYERALEWLVNSGLVYKIYRVSKPALPLISYDDLSAFKIYALDVGLLRRLANLPTSAIVEGDRLFTEFKGALTENYILQSIQSQFDTDVAYWTSNGIAEIDFLFQLENKVIPVEVKSDKNIKSKSLAVYRKKYSPEIALRYSLHNLNRNEDVINIPLFLADITSKLLKL